MAEGTDSTDRLTLKQRRFVDEYLRNGGNGVRAALAAYDTEDYGTANSIARDNLQKPVIRAAIDAAMEAESMGAKEVVWRLAAHARADLAEYVTLDAEGQPSFDIEGMKKAGLGHLLKEVKVSPGGAVTFKLHDAQAALDKLARVHGLYQDKLEVSGGIAIDDVSEIAARVRARLAGEDTDG